jgi:TolA-binding protein
MRKDLLVGLVALSMTLTSAKTSPKEALQLRRIAEFWKEGDYTAAKSQILDLLERYPESGAKQQLYTMLGDLYFFENSYVDATSFYGKVQDRELKKKIQLNYLKSLFALNRFADVIKEAAQELAQKGGERIEIHYLMAESLWRYGMQIKEEGKKLSFLSKAKDEYEALLKTKFKDSSIFPLASIHKELKEYKQAAALFLQLIEKHPEKKEDLLFQVACLQIQYDKEEACKSFASVYELGGKRAALAAYNQLLLLFQMEKHADLLQAKENALKHLSPEKLALGKLYVGKSHYALKNYQEAASHLQAYVTEKKASSAEFKSALLCLINCAKEIQDLSLLASSVEKLGELFSHDLDYARALILYAQKSEHAGNFALAEDLLKKVLNLFPDYEERESLLYEQARLLLQTKKWEESRMAFSSFVKSFPQSDKCSPAWHNLLHSALMERQQIKEEDRKAKDELLVPLLQEAMAQTNLWKEEERENYTFLLGKTLYALGKWEECAKTFMAFLNDFKSAQSTADAHLLLALSLHKAGKEEDQGFFSHAETALALKPNLENSSLLHLMLYNSYLKVAEQKKGDKALIEKAADHLYQCTMQGQIDIKKDNLLWLANYYYGRAKDEKGSQHYSKRAADIFERILKHLKAVSLDTLYLEAEAIKYADLLSMMDKHTEALQLLKELRSLYETRPDLAWKFQKRTLLELGRAYARLGDHEKALATYDFLITTSQEGASVAADSALLERARLEYGLLKKEDKIDANPRLASILSVLKDLQIKRKLQSEPVHLEAGLEYAEIKSEIAPQENKKEKALALLKSLKEEFMSEENPDSQEYQACRLRFSEKDQLFQTYMKYIDALLLEAQAALSEKEEEAKEMKEKSAQLMQELKESATLTPYLRAKLEANKSL